MGVGGEFSEDLTSTQREDLARELGHRICELAAHIHSGMAEIVELAAEMNGLDSSIVGGYKSFVNWLSVNAGFDRWMGHEISRVGEALKDCR